MTTKNKSGRSGSQKAASATQEKNITTKDNTHEIETLKRENKNIVEILQELEKKERSIFDEMHGLIMELVRNYERLHELGEYNDPLNTICAQVIRDLKTKNLLSSISTAYKIIPEKYKQEGYAPDVGDSGIEISDNGGSSYSGEVRGAGFSSSGHVSSESTTNYFANQNGGNEMFPSYRNPNVDVPMNPFKNKLQPTLANELTDEKIREQAEFWAVTDKQLKEQSRESGKRKEFFIELAQARKIALDPEKVRIIDEHLSTPVDESGESQLYHALKYYAQLIDKAADKVFKFKPADKDARKWARAVRTMAELWKPWADEKFRKDSISWMLVQMDNIAHGKHAAATMHATLTPEGIKRALTREQVGDKYEAVLQQAVMLTTAYYDLIGMHRWHMTKTERNIASRAVNMHPKLSEKS